MNKERNTNGERENAATRYQFELFRPGGNDTCLYTGIVQDQKTRKELNDTIMDVYPNIEQVGFINPDPTNAELMMAGGEFCGNATRSTAWTILKGEPGVINMKVSGVDGKLRAGVKDNGDAFAQMPIYDDPAMISQLDDGSYLVRMQGITQLVTQAPDNLSLLSKDELKQKARVRMNELGIDQDPAAGVMYVNNKEEYLSITPIVYVRDIDTLFYESACGSGTTAVGMVLAKNTGRTIETPIMQPSGMSIIIKVDYDTRFRYAEISGPIAKLSEGSLEENTSYAFEKIQTSEQLKSLFRNGELVNLYNDVFGGPPYYESFTEEEVRDEFNNYFINGFVSLARAGGKIIAFEGTCRASFSSIANVLKRQGLDPRNYWYFGDLGVDERYRRKGIGKKLTENRLTTLSDPVILRTNKNNFQALSLYRSLGFTNLEGWTQDVTQARINGSVDEDERIFLLKEK